MDQLILELYRAYFDARRHKRNSRSQLAFEVDLERNIAALAEEIADGRYRHGPYVCFITNQPVKREIFAAGFRDRVVHHLLFNRLDPLIDPKLVYDCYSCRQGKGTLFGIRRLEHFFRSGTENYRYPAWCLKLDIKGYFMSIDRTRLYGMITGLLTRESTLRLAGDIIFREAAKDCLIRGRRSDWSGLPRSKSLFQAPPGKGLPIGNLTSQLFANYYLNGLDHFIKGFLGCRYYGRYVDDLVFVHRDKIFLLTVIGEVRDYLRERLGLELHEKKIFLQLCGNGVPFLGAFIKPYRTYLGRRTKNNWRRCLDTINGKMEEADLPAASPACRRAIKDACQSLNSYIGLAGHFSTFKLYRKMTSRIYWKFWNHAYIYKRALRPRLP